MGEYCPECGGNLLYEAGLRQYVCRSCGVTYTYQQLLEAKDEARFSLDEEEGKKRRQKEYLKWWLSKKD